MGHLVLHGHRRANGGLPTPEYSTWMSMWARVRGTAGPKSRKNYVERGLTVCERWRDFSAFLADVGPRPAGTTLDRIDNDKGYEPGNCRWAPPRVQHRNKRTNRLLTHNGETLCLQEWAERLGLDPVSLAGRLRRGWPVSDALTKPPRSYTKGATNGR